MDDPFQLSRFLEAQSDQYSIAFSEIRSGRKRSHWMWYVFPQFVGLGTSPTAQLYAIKSHAEAEAYLHHPVLGVRLQECFAAVLEHPEKSAYDIFGTPDDLKLHSSATLFGAISSSGSVYAQVLELFFGGKADLKTLKYLQIGQKDVG
ncbi:MAG: DUF1810 domain-containing protein [Zavarzinella sp.]